MTGIGHHIDPGRGPVAVLIVDDCDCEDNAYLWDVTGSVVVDFEALPVTEVDGHVSLVNCDPPGTKGDVNEDDATDVLDAVAAVNYILGLIQLPGPEEIWAADCNGPIGSCDGDGKVDVLDVLKIVNLMLHLDKCGSWTPIYYNSFESWEDITEWSFRNHFSTAGNPAPCSGRLSLSINGCCLQPAASCDLPQQTEDGHYMMSLWGKYAYSGGASIILTIADSSDWKPEIRITVDSSEWKWYSTHETIFCPKKQKMRIEVWHDGDTISRKIFIDNFKVERVE